jgi:hypothetical protein
MSLSSWFPLGILACVRSLVCLEGKLNDLRKPFNPLKAFSARPPFRVGEVIGGGCKGEDDGGMGLSELTLGELGRGVSVDVEGDCG